MVLIGSRPFGLKAAAEPLCTNAHEAKVLPDFEKRSIAPAYAI
jgi:hypothetical protein